MQPYLEAAIFIEICFCFRILLYSSWLRLCVVKLHEGQIEFELWLRRLQTSLSRFITTHFSQTEVMAGAATLMYR